MVVSLRNYLIYYFLMNLLIHYCYYCYCHYHFDSDFDFDFRLLLLINIFLILHNSFYYINQYGNFLIHLQNPFLMYISIELVLPFQN